MKKRKLINRILTVILASVFLTANVQSVYTVLADEDYDDYDGGDYDDAYDEPEPEPEPQPEPEPEQPQPEPQTEPQTEPPTVAPAQTPAAEGADSATPDPLRPASFAGVSFGTLKEGEDVPLPKTIVISNPNKYDVGLSGGITSKSSSFQLGELPSSIPASGQVRVDVKPAMKSLSAGDYSATILITVHANGQSMDASQSVSLRVEKNQEPEKKGSDGDEPDIEPEKKSQPASEEPEEEPSESKSEEKKEEPSESKSEEKKEEPSEAKSEEKKEEPSEPKSEEKKEEPKKEEPKKEEKKEEPKKEEPKKEEKPAAKPVVKEVVIKPAGATVKQGGNTQFKAGVYGDNDPSQEVTWSVSGAKQSGTKIDSAGTLIIDAAETASSVAVTATSVQDKSKSDTETVTITSDPKEVTKTVTVAADPASGGQVAGGASYKQGSAVTVTAVANNGYRFTGWYKNGTERVSASNTYQFKMGDEDVGYLAKFERVSCTVKVHANHDSRGKVHGGGTVEYGGSMKLKAEPKDDNRFRGWRENDKIISKDKEIKLTNITTDRDIEAVFDKKGYKVTVTKTINEGGVISGDGTYNEGDTVKLSVSIAKGYRFDGWYLNNQKVSNAMDYKIENLDRDLNFTAMFFKDGARLYNIVAGVAQQGAGGVISPSGTSQFPEGTTFTYVMAPASGYKILAVAVDGKQVGPVKSYTFDKIRSDHTIAVAFAPDKNAVVPKTMDKIITTQEAAAIAAAKLETGGDDERASVVSDGSGGQAKSTAGSSKGSNGGKSSSSSSKDAMQPVIEETISVTDLDKEKEENLVGMDDTSGVNEEDSPDTGELTGIYATLGTTPAMVKEMVESGDDNLLLRTAYNDGFLKINVNNQYISNPDELGGADQLGVNPTVKNMDEIVKNVFTTDEKMFMFDGNETSLNLDVSQTEPSSEDKKIIESVKGVKPVSYFGVTLMKTQMDFPQVMTVIPVEAEIVLKTPGELKQTDGKVCVIREHEGEAVVLEDQDDNPDTVTIRTDRFSCYAFAVQGGKGSVNWVLISVIGAVMAAVLAIAIVLITRTSKAKARRARARKRREE